MIVGIKIGGCCSNICLLNKDGNAEPIKTSTDLSVFGNDYSLPSAVFFEKDKIVLGQKACNNRYRDHDKFRMIVTKDFGQNIPYHVNNTEILPEDILKEFLIYLKKCVEFLMGDSIGITYLVHPSNFSSTQKELLIRTAHVAGLGHLNKDNIRLLNESIGVAMNHVMEKKLFNKNQIILICDFGGTKFNFELVEYKNGTFETFPHSYELGGHGGDDFDKAIYNHIINKIASNMLENIKSNSKDLHQIESDIYEIAVKIKHQLSVVDIVEENIQIGSTYFNYSITRGDFNKLIQHFIDDSIVSISSLLNNAEIVNDKIDSILITGGTARVPLIKEKLEGYFDRAVEISINPELDAAKGAALFAISNKNDDSNTQIICPQCSNVILKNNSFCNYCGKIVAYPKYISEDMKKQYQADIIDFVKELKGVKYPDNELLLDGTVTRYIQTVRDVKAISNKDNINKSLNKDFFSKLDTFLDRCASNEFHLAIIGTIKAGKSTLINAILERELASTNVTPETASLTKFRSANTDCIRVSFYDKEDWKKLWDSVKKSNAKIFRKEYHELNAKQYELEWIGHEDHFEEYENEEDLIKSIKSWTSAKSALHYFVKEVEVGLKQFNIPKEVVFVDTPGLDDPVEYRSDITKKYIERANLIMICVNTQALTGQELGTIYKVFANTRYNKERVFVVGTQIDKLNKPIKDKIHIENEWLKFLGDENCFNDPVLAQKNLLFVSAYLYSILIKNSEELSEDEFDDLGIGLTKFKLRNKSEKTLEDLKRYTNITYLRELIMGDPIKKSKFLMLHDISEKYKILKMEIDKPFVDIYKSLEELIEGLSSGIDDVCSKIQIKQNNLNDLKSEKRELDEYLSEFKKISTKQVDEIIKSIDKVVIS